MKTYTTKSSKAKLTALSNNIIAVNGGSTPHPSSAKILNDLSKTSSLLDKLELSEVIFSHLIILN
jgi:hypothetical protein